MVAHATTAQLLCHIIFFCSDSCFIIEVGTKRYLHLIWIAMKKTFVKRGPGWLITDICFCCPHIATMKGVGWGRWKLFLSLGQYHYVLRRLTDHSCEKVLQANNKRSYSNTALLVREFTVDQWFHSQMASNAESVSMSWCQYIYRIELNKNIEIDKTYHLFYIFMTSLLYMEAMLLEHHGLNQALCASSSIMVHIGPYNWDVSI